MTPNTATRPRLLTAMALLAIFGSGMTGALAFGSNLDFLKDAPITRFSDEDRKMFQTNLTEALEQDPEGNVRKWENSKSGSSGEIAILKRFTYDNKPCREVRFTNRVRGYTDATSKTVMCKGSEGKWQFNPQAKPTTNAVPQQPAGK